MPGSAPAGQSDDTGGADWYSPAESRHLPIHLEEPLGRPDPDRRPTVHFLTSHPTPPVFDDPPVLPAGVDFNGRRNYDEIRLWADYITGGRQARYIYDDQGRRSGLPSGARFVITGMNSIPSTATASRKPRNCCSSTIA